MELSLQVQGSHVTASPSGQYLALIQNGKLIISAVTAPERFTEVNIRIPARDITAVKWNEDSDHVAINSAQNIESIDLNDASHRVRLDNGSAGLGRFASADFIGSAQLLVVWEFGKAKLWDLSNGKGAELGDIKTLCNGDAWQIRPATASAARRSLATLSRIGADDVLNLYFPGLHKHHSSVKLPTSDAQSICWSPDGRWLAVLDTPTASPSIHILTPDGHLFRSYPPVAESDAYVLGIKAIVWSPNSQTVALTKYNGQIILLNTRTFTPLAVIEHTITIDQRSLPLEQQAPAWQETVSASGDRSYTAIVQPVSPPLSKPKPSLEPSELGVREACFSCDGNFLATRDERMLNTVWIWNTATLGAHAVIIQHSNVRRLHWHTTRPDVLMMDCGEGIPYHFAASSGQSPSPLQISAPSSTAFSWLHVEAGSTSAILASTKASFRILYPEGQPKRDDLAASQADSGADVDESFNEGGSEDSLFDVLSGRKPLPPKTEDSYTERVDMEVETGEEDATTRMDDTFVGKKKSRRPIPADPFDDSEIF